MNAKEYGAKQSERAGSPAAWQVPVLRFALGLTTVVACVVLVGHFAGVRALTAVFPTARQTAAGTAAMFLLLTIAIAFVWRGRRSTALLRTGEIVAGVVVVAGLMILIGGGSSRLETLRSVVDSPNKLASAIGGLPDQAATAPMTSVIVILLGLGTILTRRRSANLAQFAAIGAIAIALVPSVGYLLASSNIYENLPSFARVGLLTAVMSVALAAAIIAANGDSGLAAQVASPRFGGRLARRILPFTLLAPIVVGWLRVLGQSLDLYGTGFGISIMVAALVVALAAAALTSTTWLNTLDEERTRAEAESLERAARIEDILETAAEGVVVLDARRKVTMANSSALKMFARDDLSGFDIADLMPSGCEAIDALDSSAAKSGFRKNLRLIGETSAGRLFPVEGSLVKRAEDDDATFTLMFRDVSERVRAENRIRALNERLEDQVRRRTEQLNRTAGDLEAFSYSVSHDLRAPLRAMSGFARILSEDYGDALPEEASQYLGRIQFNAAHMSHLIDGLLEFSKVERVAAARQLLGIHELVEEEITLIRPSLNGRRVEFKVSDMPQCMADPVLVRRVIANLLSNAVKFTQDRNPAIVEVGFDRSQDAYFIADNGVGFDDKRADRLFEVFQRLHSREKFSGAGIGLALSRRIVEKHGGTMWANSSPDKGATFYFSLGDVEIRQAEQANEQAEQDERATTQT